MKHQKSVMRTRAFASLLFGASALLCGCVGELQQNVADSKTPGADVERDEGHTETGDMSFDLDTPDAESTPPLVPACSPGQLWPVDQPLMQLSKEEVILHLNRVFYGYEVATFHQDVRFGKKSARADLPNTAPGLTSVYPSQGWSDDSFTNRSRMITGQEVGGLEEFATWYVFRANGRHDAAEGQSLPLTSDGAMYGSDGVEGWAPCHPEANASEQELLACGEQIVDALIPRLIRRPFVDEAERASYITFMQEALSAQLDVEVSLSAYGEGLKFFLFTVLQGPDVHYRIERGQEDTAGAPLTAFELANRLSFLLWKQGPDQELWRVAESGQLLESAELEAQSRRMLADPRARTSMRDFLMGWLKLDKLSQVKAKGQHRELFKEISFVLDPYPYEGETCFAPVFEVNRDQRGLINLLRADKLEGIFSESVQESAMRFVEWAFWEDGSFEALLSSSKMPANYLLSHFYGWPRVPWLPAEVMPNPDAGGACASEADRDALLDDARKVSRDRERMVTQGWQLIDLPPDQHAGIITHPAVLAMSSHDGEHSSIYRGVHLLNALLCAEVGFPGDVPSQSSGEEPCTVRQRVEWAHSASVTCQGCHGLIDGLGFSFEHYDMLGKWRDEERCTIDRGNNDKEVKTLPVNATVVIPDYDPSGQPIDVAGSYANAPELARSLASSRRVKSCMVKHLARYAFGRKELRGEGGTPEARACQAQQIEELVDTMEGQDNSMHELIIAFTLSPAFRHKAMVDPHASTLKAGTP